jgi:RNA polymerase sigma factor (sigma-70 family)
VATRKDGAVLRQLNTLFTVGTTRELTDGQLLERFSTGQGETSELAFEALVERHGAMVLRVCRARLVDPHATQDAFQATFLILIRKARDLWVRDSLGPWLHQVAFRTASCALSDAARRQRHERRAAAMAASLDGSEHRTSFEREHALHEEINRLPECYRVPIVLCDLQGFTCEEVARRMGRSVGTVKSWRFRGRERLRDRLIRLGLAPSAGIGAALTVDAARAAIPEHTVRVAVRALSVGMTAGEVSASVRMLVKGVLKTMLFSKLRTAATTIFATAFLTAGLGAVAWVAADDSNKAVDDARRELPRSAFVEQPLRISAPAKDPKETWPLTLRQAIWVDLDNSETMRLISAGENGWRCTVAPIKSAVDAQTFRAEVMAHLRSIEQVYWNLWLALDHVRACEKAVGVAEEVVKSEAAKRTLVPAAAANLSEAQVRLDQFRLDLVTKTSDVFTTERQLRFLLGLPPTDGRRIVPVTPLSEARLEPDWDTCLAAMLENQPDIVQARARLKEAEANPAGNRLFKVEKHKDSLQQTVIETTHSLGRFFLEIDANYKQFRAASNLRSSLAQRLDEQRASYQHGQSTVDRYLDTVSLYQNAVTEEARFKTSYNIAIVALEEAKGTLLDYDQITVAEGPKPTVAGRDGADTTVSHAYPASIATPNSAPATTMPTNPPPVPAPIPPTSRLDTNEPQPKNTGARADSGGKTFSFQVTIGIGSKPVEIRGSFTVTPVEAPKVE